MTSKTNCSNHSLGFIAWGLLLSITSLITGLGLYAAVHSKDLHDTSNYRFDQLQSEQTLFSCKNIIQRMWQGNAYLKPGITVLPNCSIINVTHDENGTYVDIISQYPSYATTTLVQFDIHN